MNKLDIVHVINELVFSGAELLVVNMSVAQIKHVNSVTIVSLGKIHPEIHAHLIRNGINCISLSKKISCVTNIFHLCRFLNKIPADVVHVHLFPAQYFLAILIRFRLVNINVRVTTEHSTTNRRRRFTFLRGIETFVYNQYNQIFFVSDASRKKFLEWLPSFNTHSDVLENAIDLDSMKSACAVDFESEYKIKGPTLLSVARLYPEKGLDIAIKSLKYLPGFTLFLIGDGPAKQSLVDLTYELDLTTRVHFLSSRSNVYGFMKGCDVYLQPSRWEGFGLAALEAIASGAKVVCSDVIGMSEIVEPLGAYLFETENEISLANVILMAHKNKKSAFPISSIYKYSIQHLAEKSIKKYINNMNNNKN